MFNRKLKKENELLKEKIAELGSYIWVLSKQVQHEKEMCRISQDRTNKTYEGIHRYFQGKPPEEEREMFCCLYGTREVNDV